MRVLLACFLLLGPSAAFVLRSAPVHRRGRLWLASSGDYLSTINPASTAGPPPDYLTALSSKPAKKMRVRSGDYLSSLATDAGPASSSSSSSSSDTTPAPSSSANYLAYLSAVDTTKAGTVEGEAALSATDSSSSESESSAAIAEEKKTKRKPFVVPAFVGKALRAGVLAAAVVAAAKGSTLLALRSAASVHMVAFGAVFGSMVYTTFFSGLTMYRNLPRQTFGKLQAKLFPVYFKVHAVCLAAMLGTLQVISTAAGASVDLPAICLEGALLLTLANAFTLVPLSTANMLKRYELEDQGEAGSEEVQKRAKSFKPLHALSSVSNFGALCLTAVHSWWLAGLLAL